MKGGATDVEDDAEALIDSTFSANQGSDVLPAALTIRARSTEVPAWEGTSQTVWKRGWTTGIASLPSSHGNFEVQSEGRLG